jgi:hypothetical protein
MNWTLEVVVVPVSDVDRDKAFSAEQLGFKRRPRHKISERSRIVQLTPGLPDAHTIASPQSSVSRAKRAAMEASGDDCSGSRARGVRVG